MSKKVILYIDLYKKKNYYLVSYKLGGFSCSPGFFVFFYILFAKILCILCIALYIHL